MHILFLSQVLPYPLDAGPKIRSYLVLRHLSQKHEVTLLTFVRNTDQPKHINHLVELCHEIHTVPMERTKWRDANFFLKSLLTQEPFLIARDYVPAMISKLQQLTRDRQFDIIHADQLWMVQYGLAAKKMKPSAKLILDKHNAVHLIPRRLAENETNSLRRQFLNREAKLLKQYEPKVCQMSDSLVWVTQEDHQAVSSHMPALNGSKIPSTVIPICADPSQTPPVRRSEKPFRITFLGGLHWPPNTAGILWFAEQVFPQIKANHPEAILTIIGKNPPTYLKKGEGVEVTGYVVDPTPYLTETAVFIVPLHAGGGMRVKILDAWTWGLPIVSTTIGAEGINTVSGKDIIIADTPDSFTSAVTQILQNPELGSTLAKNGRQTVSTQYNWQITYSAWDTVYSEATTSEKVSLWERSRL